MKKIKYRFSRTQFAYPYAVIGTIFVVIPLFVLLYFALTLPSGEFSFDNFGVFFGNPDYLRRLGYSILVALATTVICLLLAYPLALALADTQINKTAIMVLIFIVPMWINSLLRTYALKNIFSLIGNFDVNLKVIIGMVYDFFPFMLMPIYTILSNMDKSYIEAASDLGASGLMTFRKVVLPLSLPGVLNGVLMVFMPTVSTYSISDILGDGKTTFMFGNIINNLFNATGSLESYHLGAAFGFIMLILIALTLLIANLFPNRDKHREKGGIRR